MFELVEYYPQVCLHFPWKGRRCFQQYVYKLHWYNEIDVEAVCGENSTDACHLVMK